MLDTSDPRLTGCLSGSDGRIELGTHGGERRLAPTGYGTVTDISRR